LSLTPFVVAAGALILAAFRGWERRREEGGLDPLVHFRLFEIRSLRSGVSMQLAQNLILMGIFFTIPLFLQVVLGLDALETGVRMLPASVGLFLTAMAGSALASRFAARGLVRALVEDYEEAQLDALRIALLFAGLIVLASFWATRRLPTRRFDQLLAEAGPRPAEPASA
jgi:hypothetical protein